MAFDDDPNDRHERSLLYHAESDCLFEVFSPAEKDNCLGNADGLVSEVTGIMAFEARFKKEHMEEKEIAAKIMKGEL